MNSAAASIPGALLVTLMLGTGAASQGDAAPVSCTGLMTQGALSMPLLQPVAEDYSTIRVTLRKKQYEEALELVLTALSEYPRDPVIHGLAGDTYAALGSPDQAAYYYELALTLTDRKRHKDLEKELKKKLNATDPLLKKCRSWFNGTVNQMEESARDLLENGDEERAVQALREILPFSRGSKKAELERLIEQHKTDVEEVDIDAVATEGVKERRRLYRYESQHYSFQANLEPDVVHLLGTTLDDIYDHFVEIFLAGDASSVAAASKITIRIYSTHGKMLKTYPGDPSPGIGGWWSPSEQKVVTYDSRSTEGTFDSMLQTLFHELCHQFISVLRDNGGGKAPAWMNEGTACFFEGAKAMVDGSVLWPDAAQGRVRSLDYFLTNGGGPSVDQVISFDEPGSYPGNYYCFGWGLTYFFMEYEDPETLEHPFRPLFDKYKERILTKGGDPKELFEEVFLGSASPLGHKDLDQFVRYWQRWILDDVKPLHIGYERQSKRLALAERYLAAAKAEMGLSAEDSRSKKQKEVPAPPRKAEALLERALGHLDYIRTELNREDADELPPDELEEIVMLQLEAIRLLQRKEQESRLLEEILNLADEKRLAVADKELEAYERRLKSIDRKNYAARLLRSRKRVRARLALKIVAEYEALEPPMYIRAARFVEEAYKLTPDEDLRRTIGHLKDLASEAGMMGGTALKLYSDDRKLWRTIFPKRDEGKFKHSKKELSVESEGEKPAGRICTALPLSGTYEVRARLVREGELKEGSEHCLVFAGTPGEDGEWYMLGVDYDGRLILIGYAGNEGGDALREEIDEIDLEPPIAKDESPLISVRVTPDGDLLVKVGDREPLDLGLPYSMPEECHAGLFVFNGKVRLDDAGIETFGSE